MVVVSSLNIGDAAPSLDGTQWLKGSAPVFKNQVTIVEFWRPSCGNCKAQIPHLTALQKKYGNRISVVALSREPLDTLAEFIKANGDQMGYTIGKVTKELGEPYMVDVTGVPYAFLVNKNGIVVWKGHPGGIDDILARTVEGNIDIEQLKLINNLETALNEALKVNDAETVASIDQKLLLVDPSNEKGLEVGMEVAKYNDDPALVKKMYDQVQQKGLDEEKAGLLAMLLVSESDLAYRYPEAALKFAFHALTKDPENDSYMDVYARVLYCLGDIEKAVLWEKKALELNPTKTSYQSNLNYYLSIKTIRGKSDYNSMTQLQGSKTGQ